MSRELTENNTEINEEDELFNMVANSVKSQLGNGPGETTDLEDYVETQRATTYDPNDDKMRILFDEDGNPVFDENGELVYFYDDSKEYAEILEREKEEKILVEEVVSEDDDTDVISKHLAKEIGAINEDESVEPVVAVSAQSFIEDIDENKPQTTKEISDDGKELENDLSAQVTAFMKDLDFDELDDEEDESDKDEEAEEPEEIDESDKVEETKEEGVPEIFREVEKKLNEKPEKTSFIRRVILAEGTPASTEPMGVLPMPEQFTEEEKTAYPEGMEDIYEAVVSAELGAGAGEEIVKEAPKVLKDPKDMTDKEILEEMLKTLEDSEDEEIENFDVDTLKDLYDDVDIDDEDLDDDEIDEEIDDDDIDDDDIDDGDTKEIITFDKEDDEVEDSDDEEVTSEYYEDKSLESLLAQEIGMFDDDED